MNAEQLTQYMAEHTQTCPACGETKTLEHFYKKPRVLEWRERCKACTADKVLKVMETPEPEGPSITVTVPLYQRSRRWTAEDDAYLLANPYELTAVLAHALRRTHHAVDLRRNMLNKMEEAG